MVLCKGLGIFEGRTSWLLPSLLGEIKNSQYHSDFIGGEMKVQTWSDPGTKEIPRDTVDTVEVHRMPQKSKSGPQSPHSRGTTPIEPSTQHPPSSRYIPLLAYHYTPFLLSVAEASRHGNWERPLWSHSDWVWRSILLLAGSETPHKWPYPVPVSISSSVKGL